MTSAFPRMLAVQQRFPATPDVDIASTVAEEMAELRTRLRPGMRIAIGVGSRGITNLHGILSSLIVALKSSGAHPFIIPAMGSHGGATPEGQAQVLAEYGVTEPRLGVPVRASLDVERIGSTPEGVEVHCSVEAMRADGIILVNRIKPHTDFAGALGSGIIKMAVIGLGKRVGAATYHGAASQHGYEAMLRSVSRVMFQKAPILGGLAIIENQRHETARIAFVAPEGIEAREEALCAEARRLMPKLPFADVDLLIIDFLGKNISGSGMDPNIVGRPVHGYLSLLGQADAPAPRVKRIFVRDLTPETHGNAIGIGLADFTTARVAQALNRQVTYVNVLTSLTPHAGKLPMYFDTDREAVQAGLDSLALRDPAQTRVVRIQDTLNLEQVEVSEAYVPELEGRSDLHQAGQVREMAFDEAGQLGPIARSSLLL